MIHANSIEHNGTPSSSVSGGFKGLTATLQAMEQVGVVRTELSLNLGDDRGQAAEA